MFDDGAGPRLVIAGYFAIHGVPGVHRLARWEGSSWQPLPLACGQVSTMRVWDDGSGPALYLGGVDLCMPGQPSTGLMKWDGVSTVAVGGQVEGTVLALEVFDAGGGESLYVGGRFQYINSVFHPAIVRWNGTSWQSVGGALGLPLPEVRALLAHDDGAGPRLYAAGEFYLIGGEQIEDFARLGATGWTPATSTPLHGIRNLCRHAFGTGIELVAAGTDVLGSSDLAHWNGSSWSTLPDPFPSFSPGPAVSFDAGMGAKLYVASNAIAPPYVEVRAWNGAVWLPAAPAGGEVWDGYLGHLNVVDLGSGPRLLAGGSFGVAGGIVSNGLTLFDGTSWSRISPTTALVGEVNALHAFDDGSGSKLFVGGAIFRAGSHLISKAARWDGTQWFTAPGLIANRVHRFVECDTGTGNRVHALGSIVGIGGTASRGIARWNGSSFEPVPQSPNLSSPNTVLEDAVVFDDGGGASLFVAGDGEGSDTTFPHAVGRWRNGVWSTLGAGLQGVGLAVVVHDDGSGPAVYAAGAFTSSGALPLQNIARWDGTQWNDVGGGFALTTTGTPWVHSLVVFDDGDGPALYAGGRFDLAGGQSASNVARWKSGAWSALGAGIDSTSNYRPVAELAVFDDGRGFGDALYAAGDFTAAGGALTKGVARWNGASWQTLGTGLDYALGFNHDAYALATADLGAGRELFVGGAFQQAGGQLATNLARWTSCGETGTTYCFGDGSGTACPCGNASAVGDRAGCANSFGTGAALRGRGESSLSSDTLVLEGTGMPNSAALYFQASGAVNGGAGAVFGDGLRCTSGPFIRLGTKENSAGASRYPIGSELAISVRGGVTIPGTKHYAIRYRNAAVFCASETFNYSNAVRIQWRP